MDLIGKQKRLFQATMAVYHVNKYGDDQTKKFATCLNLNNAKEFSEAFYFKSRSKYRRVYDKLASKVQDKNKRFGKVWKEIYKYGYNWVSSLKQYVNSHFNS